MSSLGPLRSFPHGVHPDERKDSTAGLPIERMPFTERYVLPLSQHTGAPSRAIVVPGQRVRRGQRIADPGGWVSTALHSPVAGTVERIAPRRHPNGSFVESIEIAVDPFDPQAWEPRPAIDPDTMDLKAFAEHVQRAGIVGLGGAAFPTHVKLLPPEGRKPRFLVVNGAECEPFLTCDHRLMLERSEAVLRGTRIVARKLDVERAFIGIEANKGDAIEALRAGLRPGEPLEIVACAVKYPQGAEKMLIQALTGRVVPAGRLPLDVGIVVSNVGSIAAIADLFDLGIPLCERVLTVSGPGVRRPSNLLCPIGVSVREVLAHVDARATDGDLVLMGGPMMGFALPSLDVPVLKGTSGLLVLPAADAKNAMPCIRCGRCLDACACRLNPSTLGRLAAFERWEGMEALHVMDCMECAACSFVCPSRIPLVQLFRMAKARVRKRKASA
jgi:electron transport complex protein RnfC